MLTSVHNKGLFSVIRRERTCTKSSGLKQHWVEPRTAQRDSRGCGVSKSHAAPHSSASAKQVVQFTLLPTGGATVWKKIQGSGPIVGLLYNSWGLWGVSHLLYQVTLPLANWTPASTTLLAVEWARNFRFSRIVLWYQFPINLVRVATAPPLAFHPRCTKVQTFMVTPRWARLCRGSFLLCCFE